jgi:DNA polymerase-4
MNFIYPLAKSINILVAINGKRAFRQLYTRRMMLRLIVVRLSGLVHGNCQFNLFDDTEEYVQLYQALDKIRHKNGLKSIMRGNTVGLDKRLRRDANWFGT